jgi:uncharacterized protein (DUF433 family)/DNA-binding transcriptional regulator YdaS (Cro superfamily)
MPRDVCHTPAVAASLAALDYVRGRVPLYTVTGAARLLGVPPSTFSTWVNGYERNPPGRKPVIGAGMVTRISVPGRGPSIPFVGLAEGAALAAFRRRHEIPFPRIRAAVTALESGLGITNALASMHFYSLGPRLLYDYARQADDAWLMDLVELDTGQAVFAPIVREYLQVAFDDDGWVERLRVPIYRRAVVYADPHHASGEPFFEAGGVPVLDVIGRYLGGDPVGLLSQDYGIPEEQITEAIGIAQPTAA